MSTTLPVRISATCRRCGEDNMLVSAGAAPDYLVRCSRCNDVLGQLGELVAIQAAKPAEYAREH